MADGARGAYRPGTARLCMQRIAGGRSEVPFAISSRGSREELLTDRRVPLVSGDFELSIQHCGARGGTRRRVRS